MTQRGERERDLLAPLRDRHSIILKSDNTTLKSDDHHAKLIRQQRSKILLVFILGKAGHINELISPSPRRDAQKSIITASRIPSSSCLQRDWPYKDYLLEHPLREVTSVTKRTPFISDIYSQLLHLELTMVYTTTLHNHNLHKKELYNALTTTYSRLFNQFYSKSSKGFFTHTLKKGVPTTHKHSLVVRMGLSGAIYQAQ